MDYQTPPRPRLARSTFLFDVTVASLVYLHNIIDRQFVHMQPAERKEPPRGPGRLSTHVGTGKHRASQTRVSLLLESQ